MSQLTATHIAYSQVCERKLWLFHHGIRMEHTSDTVAEGKLIHETTYPQRTAAFEEVEIEGSKIDFYDAKNKVVHEVKKSNKMDGSHIAQVKYYLYLLRKNGIVATGLLEYPKLRQTQPVTLDSTEIPEVESWVSKVNAVINQESCPPRLTKKTFCRSCSYFDFCWTEEDDIG